MLNGKSELLSSENAYDWLGHGIYFWENDPKRAMQYATYVKKHRARVKQRIREPFVLGAIVDLGHCLDLLNSDCLDILRTSYELLVATGAELPQNKPIDKEGDLLLRHLDCATVQALHGFNENNNRRAYDSVRGVFWEGAELYPNAGFKAKNHIQICVRNPNCIKGYFLPRSRSADHPRI